MENEKWKIMHFPGLFGVFFRKNIAHACVYEKFFVILRGFL